MKEMKEVSPKLEELEKMLKSGKSQKNTYNVIVAELSEKDGILFGGDPQVKGEFRTCKS